MEKAQKQETQRSRCQKWFTSLRDQICQEFESLEKIYLDLNPMGTLPPQETPAFTPKSWSRPGGGGGVMSVLKGNVFEKVGVNISTVHGEFSSDFKGQIPGTHEDPRFWASGISLVAHMRSPLVPAVHMNTRHVVTTQGWFGGGADMTPYYPQEKDTQHFHKYLKEACDAHNPLYYPQFKKGCDAYFYLPHRQETRGVGGIFYDALNSGDWEADFAFTQDVGRGFLKAFLPIVRKNMILKWTPEQREHQLIRRGRYVEFNLLYDRGTQFGFKTGGNSEAILMSMPPEVKWP